MLINGKYGGLIMPNSPVAMPATPNKQLYNGGSEWQNDYSNLPDYYQTLNRNYDAAIGRFIGVDPQAEHSNSMTSYNYAGNNPVYVTMIRSEIRKLLDMQLLTMVLTMVMMVVMEMAAAEMAAAAEMVAAEMEEVEMEEVEVAVETEVSAVMLEAGMTVGI